MVKFVLISPQLRGVLDMIIIIIISEYGEIVTAKMAGFRLLATRQNGEVKNKTVIRI